MAIKDQTSLIRDLLDPDLDTAEVARRHNAEPDDLRSAVRSAAFQAAAAALREVDQARTAALLPAHQARAVRRLAAIAAQPAETTAQTESARRAATALIRCKAEAPGRDAEAESSQTPPPERRSAHEPPPMRPRTPAGPTVGDLLAALAGLNTLSEPTPDFARGVGKAPDATASPAARLFARAGAPSPPDAHPHPPPRRGAGM